MIRPMRLLALTLSALSFAAGCSGGPDAHDAQQLLERAQAEQAKLASMGYELQMNFAMDGQQFGFSVDGAAQLKGRSAGDQFLRMRAAGLPTGLGAGSFEMLMAKRGSRVTMSINGQRQSFDGASSGAPDLGSMPSFGSVVLAGCVKSVDVEPGKTLNGEPVTRVGGVIDTACILRAAAKVGGLSKAAGEPFDVGEFAKHVDVVRATLFVSDRTQLLVGGVISTQLNADGRSVDVQLTYRLKRVNEPLRFPRGF